MANMIYGSNGSATDARELLDPIAPDLYRAHRAAAASTKNRTFRGLAYTPAEIASMISAATEAEIEPEVVATALTIERAINRGGGVTETVRTPFRFGPFSVKRYNDAFAFVAVSPVPEPVPES